MGKTGIVYYTDNRLSEDIDAAVKRQLQKCCNGHVLVSVSLKPIKFGNNIVLDAQRGYLTMFQQILTGIENCNADIIFLAEHDVLYHPSHFEFVPVHKDRFYYDENIWNVDYETGKALFYRVRKVSQLCAYRELLLKHYRRRVELVERNGFTRRMGFEPGTHRRNERVDDTTYETYFSEYPSIDIRHSHNMTQNRWRKDQFRNQPQDWQMADGVPGWGLTLNNFDKVLNAI